MCTANASQTGFNFHPTRSSLSREAMRYNRSNSSKQESQVATSSSRPGIHQPGLDGGRRCQSAHARPSAPLRSDRPIKQVRSHSQEPLKTTCVPIPQNRRHGDPSSGNVERTDLTRIYDYATWNMYERIVNARRQRLSWLDAQQKHGDKTSAAITCPAADISFAATDSSTLKAGALNGDIRKVHTREDSMTSSTVDDAESDKSSPTLSSASSSVSTASLSSGSKGTDKSMFFSLGAIKASHHQEQEVEAGSPEVENEEHFIFELDM